MRNGFETTHRSVSSLRYSYATVSFSTGLAVFGALVAEGDYCLSLGEFRAKA